MSEEHHVALVLHSLSGAQRLYEGRSVAQPPLSFFTPRGSRFAGGKTGCAKEFKRIRIVGHPRKNAESPRPDKFRKETEQESPGDRSPLKVENNADAAGQTGSLSRKASASCRRSSSVFVSGSIIRTPYPVPFRRISDVPRCSAVSFRFSRDSTVPATVPPPSVKSSLLHFPPLRYVRRKLPNSPGSFHHLLYGVFIPGFGNEEIREHLPHHGRGHGTSRGARPPAWPPRHVSGYPSARTLRRARDHPRARSERFRSFPRP